MNWKEKKTKIIPIFVENKNKKDGKRKRMKYD